MDPWIINPYDLNEEYRMCTYPTIMYDRYAISNYGNVYNCISDKQIKQWVNNDYYVSRLKQIDGPYENTKIHRLVAWEFVPYRRDYNLQVNHKDGNKLNNNYENLEWVTPEENTRHAIELGLRSEHGGSCKLTEEIVHYVCQLLSNPNNSYGFIVEQIEDNFGISVCVGTVEAIAHNKIWRNIASQYNIPFRNKMGECQPNSILTEEDVHFICQQYKLGRRPGEIITMLNKNISVGTITSIIKGINWKHISSQYNLTPHSSNGEGNHNAKLTENDVRFIREQYRIGKNANEILELLGKDISIHTIKSIMWGKAWKHLL